MEEREIVRKEKSEIEKRKKMEQRELKSRENQKIPGRRERILQSLASPGHEKGTARLALCLPCVFVILPQNFPEPPGSS